MVFGIATGCFWHLGLQELEILRFLKQFEVDAVELVFAFPQELFDFAPTRADMLFLRSKKYVSIHAPFHETEYKNNPETRKIILALDSLAGKVGARNVVFHDDCIKDFCVFDSANFLPLIENLAFKKGVERIVSVRQTEDFLLAHKNFGFCLDIGDALVEGINPKDFLQLEKKIVEMHVHFPIMENCELKLHGSPSKTQKKFLELAKPVLSLSVPKIFEATDFFSKDKKAVEKELELAKSLACKN